MDRDKRKKDDVFTNIIGKAGSLEGIMLCLRFLAIQAVAQGHPDLASNIEEVLDNHDASSDGATERTLEGGSVH